MAYQILTTHAIGSPFAALALHRLCQVNVIVNNAAGAVGQVQLGAWWIQPEETSWVFWCTYVYILFDVCVHI